jgi:sterol desaturase/sphingolipid hydroxylase (fatty acid hydroxylase superfamily)
MEVTNTLTRSGATPEYGLLLEVFRRVLPYVIGLGYPALGVLAVLHHSKPGVYGVYVLVAGTALLAERVIPWVPVPPERSIRNRRTDITYMFTAPLILLIVVATLPPFLAWVRNLLLGDLILWPRSLPTAAQVAVALLGVELGYYWAHRISHHNAYLWQSHRIHHSPESIDWLMGWRVQWLNESIHLTARYVPLVMLGVPPHVGALVIVIINTHTMFPHANIDVRSGRFLNSWLNTPEVHRWHHVQELRFAHSNFGDVLIVWDRLFRTFNRPGVGTATELGLPVDQLAQVPESWFRQLYSPLLPKRWAAGRPPRLPRRPRWRPRRDCTAATLPPRPTDTGTRDPRSHGFRASSAQKLSPTPGGFRAFTCQQSRRGAGRTGRFRYGLRTGKVCPGRLDQRRARCQQCQR